MRNRGLDSLRAVAILMVMMWHFPKVGGQSIFGVFGASGLWGVDLFFVLSGYLIGDGLFLSLSNETFSFWSFYLRRSLRTMPSYAVVVALYFLIPEFRENPVLPPLWKFLTFTQNINLGFSAFSHAWSLCIEEQFYFVLPLFGFFLLPYLRGRWGYVLFALFLLGGMILRGWLWTDFVAGDMSAIRAEYFSKIYYPTWSRLDGLVFGVGLAAVKNYQPALWERLTGFGNQFLLGGFVVTIFGMVILLHRFEFWSAIVGYPTLAFGFAMLLLSALSRDSWLAKIRIPGVKTIAVLAYTLYLIHKQMFHLAPGISGIILSFIAAALLRFAVEVPFLHLRDRLAPHRQG